MVQPVSGKSQLDRRNLRKASALLDEAGWKAGSDGMRVNAKGERLKLEILNDNQSFDRIINPFVQNLRALGIDAVNARVDDAQMTARTRSHDFDMITDNFLLGFYVGGGTEQVFGSENVGDVFNPAGLANPAIDALIEKGIQQPRRKRWTPSSMRWTAACARCASGCRNGTRPSIPSHITTFSPIPRPCRPMRWVSLISGGMTRIRRKS